MELYLIRHAEIAGDPHQHYQPPVEGCLSDLGCRQAAALGAALRGVKFSAVYASPLGRAIQTAHAVADPRHGKDWLDHVVSPLAERHPDWAPRIVTGAAWRSHVNAAFFAMAATRQPGRADGRDVAQRSA